MTTGTLIAHSGTAKISREELQKVPTPEGTKTHQPLSHYQIVEALIETLSFRHIEVVGDEYAVSPDGMRMFGVVTLNYEYSDCRFAMGIRNSNDKTMRLALVVGLKVTVCDNMMFKGDFQPVLAKHTKNFSLIDSLSIGVDRIQRNFEPLKSLVCAWQSNWLDDNQAKLIIYDAFMDGKLGAPKTLMPTVHRHYFEPQFEEFHNRTLWSLSNAFTSAFKELKPVRQFQATAKLGDFLEGYQVQP
jgi:hypothetical protein